MHAAITVSVLLLVATNAGAADYVTPRTSFGDPDLQGVWNNATITGVERPNWIDKLVLTPAEAALVEQRTRQFAEAGNEPTDPNEGAPPVSDNPGGYNSFWIDAGTTVARVRGEYRSSLIVEPADGRIPYRPEIAAKRMQLMAAIQSGMDGPEQRPLGERCIVGFGSTSGPPMLPVLYNNNYQIVQSPGHVMILVEMNHDARIIRLGGDHLPAHIRPWMGDSIGHWEGDTLVVETTNFNPGHSLRACIRYQIYFSPDLEVIERFTRVADDEILYEFTVDDPTAYTQTWRGEIPFKAGTGPVYEYACHEGNYSLPGILAGARAEEKSKSGGGE